jgi:hypothetical protein
MLANTLQQIQTESQRLLDSEQMHIQRQQRVLQQTREAQQRKQWAQLASQQLQFAETAEADLRRQLLLLQRTAMQTESEMVTIGS